MNDVIDDADENMRFEIFIETGKWLSEQSEFLIQEARKEDRGPIDLNKYKEIQHS